MTNTRKSMNKVRLSQMAFGACLVAMGIQQLAYGNISANFLPEAWAGNSIYQLAVYPWGVAFTLSGIAYLIPKKGYEVALISGGIFLLCFLLGYAPYMLFSAPNRSILYWAPAMETLAFTGASFVMAGSFQSDVHLSSPLLQGLARLIPYAGVFFSCMLIVFGIDHFLITDFVAQMVPSWIPFHYFWTYLTGVALIGAGISITLRIQVKLVATLLAAMIFTWFLILHIPSAIANPTVAGGLEVTRVFVTFGFTGIALLMADRANKKIAQ